MQQFNQMIKTAQAAVHHSEPVLAGNSMAAHGLRQMVALAAQSAEPVQLTGPDDAGYVQVAKAVHDKSALCAEPFVDASHGQMDEDHFAIRWRGTLFMGDVGRLTLPVQLALLNWMESSDGQYVRVISSARERAECPALVVAQLHSRLSALTIPYPPLARRSDDIPIILQRLWADGTHPLPPIFERSAWSAILSHGWPGNFRELRDFAGKSARLYGGRTVGAQQIHKLLGNDVAHLLEQPDFSLSYHLAQEEKLFLIEALLRSGGVVQAAADRSGLKRTTFLAKLKRHGLARF